MKKSRSRGSESPFWKTAWRGNPGVSSIRSFPTIQRKRNFKETIPKCNVLCLTVLKSKLRKKYAAILGLWMRSSRGGWDQTEFVGVIQLSLCGWDWAEFVDEIYSSLWMRSIQKWMRSSWVCGWDLAEFEDENSPSLWARSSCGWDLAEWFGWDPAEFVGEI